MTKPRNLLERLDDASTHGKPLTLSFPDVRLLMRLAGQDIADAYGEYERWKGIVVDHARLEEKYPLPGNQESGD